MNTLTRELIAEKLRTDNPDATIDIDESTYHFAIEITAPKAISINTLGLNLQTYWRFVTLPSGNLFACGSICKP